ncbi:cell division cycle-associated protein 4 [Aplochiton taeniatus]
MGQWEVMSFEKTPSRIGEAEFPTASMCQLNVESSPDEGVEQPGHVIHPRYLVGRGVKRKLSGCVDSERDLSYPQQRQLVLALCLAKLQSCQRRPEPCLQRSVLLGNTLRHIQREMGQEGGPSPSLSLSPAAAASAVPAPLAPALPRPAPELPPEPSELWAALSSSWDKRDVEQASFREATGDNWQWPSAGAEQGRTPCLLDGCFELPSSTSYLTDLQLDDIFEDIDTSMYDSTDFPTLPCPSSRGGGLKPPPPTCTSSNTMQLCFTDLNDLDHIMEILVSG